MLLRRDLLRYASGLALSAMARSGRTATLCKRAGFVDYPFKLGVASGDPLANGVVLWTRLAPVPFDPEAMPKQAVAVEWEVAEQANMKKVVRSGVVLAKPENAHAVHVEVEGLLPDREYFYRFISGSEVSPVGRTRTLPLPGAPVSEFRFALASCQSITDGYYGAYLDMVRQRPQLIIHTGDYIYETAIGGVARRIPVTEAKDLSDYRLLYARYKLDTSLQAAHAAAPWLMIWDDHEVDNDWGALYSEDPLTPDQFVRRKAAAFKAHYEHLPLRLSARLVGGDLRMYRRSLIGDLIQFDLLDARQYRDNPPCVESGHRAPRLMTACEEAAAASRSLLGVQQEQWLQRGLGAYGAAWNVLVQPTMIGPFDFARGAGTAYERDGWDGYPATRQRILDTITRKGVANPISLGGNIHAFYAGVVHEQAEDFNTVRRLSEFVCTSISSGGGGEQRYRNTNDLFADNPGAVFFDNRVRGYCLCHVNHRAWHTKMRMVDNPMDPESDASTLEEFVVESGKVEIARV